MEDIELARRLLEQENLSLAVVKAKQTLITSTDKGVRPLFDAIVTMGERLHGAAMADKIVGSAAAMLCLYAEIASVYANAASKKALAMLQEQGVNVTAENLVPLILNRDGTDMCLFEKLAGSAGSPSLLFSTLESVFAEHNQLEKPGSP